MGSKLYTPFVWRAMTTYGPAAIGAGDSTASPKPSSEPSSLSSGDGGYDYGY